MTLLEAVGLVGGVASVAGLLYAIYYARRNRRVKLLTYDTTSSVPLATAQSPEDDYSLAVLFQRKDGPEERIGSVHVQFLRFANIGREPIRRADIAPSSPLRICVDGSRVLDIALSASSRPVTKAEVTNVKLATEHSEADIIFDFLDYQDGGVVKILTEGGSAKARLSGDIIGMPEGINRTDEIRSLGLLNKLGCALGGVLQLTALVLAVFAFRWITGSWQHFWILALPFVALFFPGIIIAIIASTIWPSEEVPLPASLVLPKWFRRLPHYRMLSHPDTRGVVFYGGGMPEVDLEDEDDQQDEFTGPSKAAPSASSDSR